MQTLKKGERLSNFHQKKLLFSQGKRFFLFPFGITYRVVAPGIGTPSKQDPSNTQSRYITSPSQEFVKPCKILVSAPKRVFKKAVMRNRVRRLVKEAYRKNKIPFHTFLEEKGLNCLVSVAYTTPVVLPLGELEEKMVGILQAICNKISTDIERGKIDLA